MICLFVLESLSSKVIKLGLVAGFLTVVLLSNAEWRKMSAWQKSLQHTNVNRRMSTFNSSIAESNNPLKFETNSEIEQSRKVPATRNESTTAVKEKEANMEIFDKNLVLLEAEGNILHGEPHLTLRSTLSRLEWNGDNTTFPDQLWEDMQLKNPNLDTSIEQIKEISLKRYTLNN
jgi:hypothetical protein